MRLWAFASSSICSSSPRGPSERRQPPPLPCTAALELCLLVGRHAFFIGGLKQRQVVVPGTAGNRWISSNGHTTLSTLSQHVTQTESHCATSLMPLPHLLASPNLLCTPTLTAIPALIASPTFPASQPVCCVRSQHLTVSPTLDGSPTSSHILQMYIYIYTSLHLYMYIYCVGAIKNISKTNTNNY